MSNAQLYSQMTAYQLSQAVSVLSASYVLFDQTACVWSHVSSGAAMEAWADAVRDKMTDEINDLCGVLFEMPLSDADDVNYRLEAFAKALTFLRDDLSRAVSVQLEGGCVTELASAA